MPSLRAITFFQLFPVQLLTLVSLIHLLLRKLAIVNYLSISTSWNMEGNGGMWGKHMHSQEDHANSTQRAPMVRMKPRSLDLRVSSSHCTILLLSFPASSLELTNFYFYIHL